MNTRDKLKELGFNDKEIEILNILGNKGSSDVTYISKTTNIPRSSVYRYLEDLKTKGIINWELTTQGKNVILASFDQLKSKLEDQKEELNSRIDLLNQLPSDFSQLLKISKSQPSVRYYEGKEGIRQIIWNTLKSKNLIKVYSNAIRKEILGEKWLRDYCMEFIKRDLNEKVLGDTEYANDSYQKYGGREKYYSPVNEYYKRSDERILDKKMLQIKGEMYIYDNIVSFYTWEGNELVGSEIESEFISGTQSSIFDVLWDLTNEVDVVDKYK